MAAMEPHRQFLGRRLLTLVAEAAEEVKITALEIVPAALGAAETVVAIRQIMLAIMAVRTQAVVVVAQLAVALRGQVQEALAAQA